MMMYVFTIRVHVCVCVCRKSSNLACTLSGHGSWVLSVDFAPDQQHFVSSSSDHTVKVWDFAQRNCVHTFKDHHDQVGSRVFQGMGRVGNTATRMLASGHTLA